MDKQVQMAATRRLGIIVIPLLLFSGFGFGYTQYRTDSRPPVRQPPAAASSSIPAFQTQGSLPGIALPGVDPSAPVQASVNGNTPTSIGPAPVTNPSAPTGPAPTDSANRLQDTGTDKLQNNSPSPLQAAQQRSKVELRKL